MVTRLLSVLLCFCMTSLAHGASGEAPFSTNDLSVLFPLDAQNKPVFQVQPGDANWKVLSLDHFNSVIAGARAEKTFLTPKLKDPKNWYLVAIRYAPCMLFSGEKCKEQIRFVFQSLNAERGLDGFDDYSMHVVFAFSELPSPMKSPRLESFRTLKNKFSDLTLNKPLGKHPALSGPRAQEYFQAFRQEVIQKHINNKLPALITFQGLGFADATESSSNGDHWIFLSGNIESDGRWKLAPLKVGAPLHSEHLNLSSEDEAFLATNIKSAPGQFNLFAEGMTNELSSEMSLQILNQRATNDHNTSCASCHQADARVFPVLLMSDDHEGRTKFVKDISAMLKTNSRVTEMLIDNSIHIGKMGFEVPAVRIFGYLDNRALVSQRVVIDSAIAVEQANQLIGVQPKPQCTTDQQRVDLITCLYLKEHDADLNACLRKACR